MRPVQLLCLCLAVVLSMSVGPVFGSDVTLTETKTSALVELSVADSNDASLSNRQLGSGEIILAAKKKTTSKKTTKKKTKVKKGECRKCGAWRYCGKKLQNAIDFGICD